MLLPSKGEGVISFVSAPDYEAQAVFEVTIVVSDGTDQTRQRCGTV